MPVYEYYCRTCEQRFDLLRPIVKADEPAACPEGHAGASRTITLFATIGRAGDQPFAALPTTGGCACGGACACGGH
jgi:putative FmdB family regulatory protein